MLQASPVDAQILSKRFSLTYNITSLHAVLTDLQEKTNTDFGFTRDLELDKIPIAHVQFNSTSLKDILTQLLKGHNISFKEKDGAIVFFRHKVQQQGKISGKILDERGEVLPGATIRVAGSNISTQSAVDGSYSIGLAPGKYTVEVSYISFQTSRITDVLVSEGKLTGLSIVLKTKTKGLSEVIVTASYRKASVEGLYARQKNAASVTDGISAEQIARVPDNNMGQVLKRISGLNTVDNRYVIVRGLTERYNQGMIDGITLPSTDMNRRNFAFDVIPVEMVSNVVVNKTATPDVSAEFSGGQVSVNTLDIPAENFTIFSLGTGFNTNTLGKTFVESGRRGKYDFFGFDDGHRNLPKGIQSWGSQPTIPDYAVSQSKLFSPDVFKRYVSTGGANQNYRLSLGRNYALRNEQRVGFVAGLSFRNMQETSEFQDVRSFPLSLRYPDHIAAYIDSADRRRNGYVYRYNSTLGAQLNVGIQGKKYKIGLKNLYSQLFNNALNTSTGMVNSNGWNQDDERTQRNLQDPEVTRILQHKLDGEYSLTPEGLKLTWLAARTGTRQQTKDRTKFTYSITGRKDGVAYYQDPNVTVAGTNEPDYDFRLFTNTKETDYNWAANLSQPFDFLGDKSLIKGGYAGIHKRRSLDATKMIMRSEDRNFNKFDRPYEEVMAPENMGTGENGNQAYYYADGNNGSQFDGTARYHAGYLMLDQHFLKMIRIVYGIRAEKYDLQNKQSEALARGDNEDVTGEKNTSYLPSANLTFKLTPQMNFRASFAKTIIRPDFRETSYFGFYDPFLNADIVGDNVVSTKINNTDLRYEWYPSAGEIISVSGFYKTFDKPIELVVDNDATGRVTRFRFQNQKNATNYGIELEFRKSLGFISPESWLNKITVFGNGTLIKSKIFTLTTLGDRSIKENKESRALYGQSPYTINAGISYTSDRYGMTASYNRSGRRTYTIASDPRGTEYENGRNLLDLQLYGRFLKQRMELKLNVSNLLDAASIYYVNNNGYISNGESVSSDNYVLTPTNGKDKYEKEYDDVRFRMKNGISSTLSITYKF